MAENINTNEDYEEYETFTTTTRNGEEVEMAIVDRFVFEDKHYVAAALVVGDEISDDGLYVYRSLKKGDDISIEKIEDPDEYTRIAEAYANM